MTASTIVSLIYFVSNVVFLLILSIIVFKTGSHKTVKSKSFIYDLWWQKKIYGAILIYFYDTCTDIGVIIDWYFLMELEKNDDNVDYVSINMTAFFWTGIALLIFYRLSLCVMLIIFNLFDMDGTDYHWTDCILALFDLYVFKAVYCSFQKAQPTLKENAQIREDNNTIKQKEKQKQNNNIKTNMEITIEEKEGNKSNEEKESKKLKKRKEASVEPYEQQKYLQIIETVTESVPQIVIQSVFIIRSANDPVLSAQNQSDLLIVFSIIASLISISYKFGRRDKEEVKGIAQSLSVKKECDGKQWYFARILWRICHVISRFTGFVLVWAVMGGIWIGIWCFLMYILWFIVSFYKDLYLNRGMHLGGQNTSCCASFFEGFKYMIGIDLDLPKICHIVKYIENGIALFLSTIFSVVTFECTICEKSANREIYSNNNVLTFFIMGYIAFGFEIILYVVLVLKDIVLTQQRSPDRF